jgi:tetratricopeptide (TPR) repeat protein
LGELAIFYSDQERFEQAVATHRRALEISEEMDGEDHPAVAVPLINLGGSLYHLGQFEEAEAVLLRAIKLIQPVAAEREVFAYSLLVALNNLNQTCEKQGNHNESAATLIWALETASRDLGEDHPAAESIRGMAASK